MTDEGEAFGKRGQALYICPGDRQGPANYASGRRQVRLAEHSDALAM